LQLVLVKKLNMLKKFSVFASALILVTGSIQAQKSVLAGHWEGAMSRLGSVQLLKFDLLPVGDSLEVQFDDPAQGYYRRFLEGNGKVAAGDSVFDIDFGYGKFHCILNKKYRQITGYCKEWRPEVLFHIKKMGAREDDPYTEENISFSNGDVKLAGTIYKPLGQGAYPLVILIHGSDAQTRRTPYIRSLVYVLTKNHIGVVVYDKRGTGSSGGNMQTAGFDDLANDVSACIRYIGRRKDLSITKLGLFATSQGGWIAPRVANKWKNIEFVILNVGPAVPLFKQDLDRVEFTMRANGFGQKTIDSAMQHSRLYFDVVQSNTGWDALQKSVAFYKTKDWAKEDNLLQLPEKMNDDDMLWWRSHDYDPKTDLSRMKCRVLSLMGGSDNLVPPATNQQLMEQYLTKAGCSHKIVVLPNAGHNAIAFQTLEGHDWKWPDHFWIWPQRSELYYDEIVNWIKNDK
jgi:pimeloyl-ACP methyl ester carboxylesterase